MPIFLVEYTGGVEMKATWKDFLRYHFDNFMSKGTTALIGGLAVVSLLVILIGGGIVAAGGKLLGPVVDGEPRPLSFLEAVWWSLMRTFDAGTMGGDEGWGFRVVMLFVTVGGILIVSTLIGVLTAGVEGKLDELRKGRSRVLESGHVIILGWSPQVFTILSELITAGENQKDTCLVILAEQDKVAMEDEIRERMEIRGHTRIICRSGSPMDPTALGIVSPDTAKAIIILPPADGDQDAMVIKTVLAITGQPHRRSEPYHIVTQIRDARNLDILRMIGERDLVQAVLTGDLIARVTAQTSRQSGLSVVYTELFNFGGDEVYFTEEPTLVGKTYGEALLAYEDSAVMGWRPAGGTACLNPPMDTVLRPGDRLFGLTQDDDTFVVSGAIDIHIDENAIRMPGSRIVPRPEKYLILGWNRRALTILHELDCYTAPDSQALLIADTTLSDEVAEAELLLEQAGQRFANLTVSFRQGDTTDRGLLESVQAAEYNHVIVLSYAGLDVQDADAKTLVTLLHLRHIAEQDETPFSIVSEMLDVRNRELAQVTGVDDFIVSDHLVSLMMAQLAEDDALEDVFADILDPEGAEIYLKPIGDYIETGRPVNFYTVVEAARRRGETAIGYRHAAEAGNPEASYGIHTNPRKSERVVFQPEDRVIVLAEA